MTARPQDPAAPTPSTLLFTLIALLILLVLAVATLLLPGGLIGTLASLLIGAAKAVFVVLIFMRVRGRRDSSLIFVLTGFFWLAILFVLTFTDYLTRGA